MTRQLKSVRASSSRPRFLSIPFDPFTRYEPANRVISYFSMCFEMNFYIFLRLNLVFFLLIAENTSVACLTPRKRRGERRLLLASKCTLYHPFFPLYERCFSLLCDASALFFMLRNFILCSLLFFCYLSFAATRCS